VTYYIIIPSGRSGIKRKMTHYTYKYRLVPNQDQQAKLAANFGCVRFVYNHFLAQRKEQYLQSKEGTNYNKQAGELTALKKELTWLKDANSQSLQHSLKCLQAAYNNFFSRRTKFPRFHSRKGKQSFTVPQHIEVREDRIHFPKFKEGIKLRLHRPLEGEIKHATISRNKAGQFFACILVEKDIHPLPRKTNEVGIDLGISALATCSNGEVFDNIRPYRNLQRRLRLMQKSVSRREPGSKNREKARRRLAKVHQKIADIRNDHLHKVSRSIVDENQVIVLETLNVSGMMRNHCLAKSIADVSLSDLVRKIEYKAGWAGRTFLQVDRWFPSSKTCSGCGFIVDKLPLSIREWECPKCGEVHDRDYNASVNILREGKRTVGTTGIACGLVVSPSATKAIKVETGSRYPLG
jgi:putative transposase